MADALSWLARHQALMARLMLLVLGVRRTRRMKKSMRPAPPPRPAVSQFSLKAKRRLSPRPAPPCVNLLLINPAINKVLLIWNRPGGIAYRPRICWQSLTRNLSLAMPNRWIILQNCWKACCRNSASACRLNALAPVRWVTRYDLNPAPGTKTQRVISLSDDIARSMSALSVRVAVVPGQNVIGIELPNQKRQTVLLRDVLDSPGLGWGRGGRESPTFSIRGGYCWQGRWWRIWR